MLKCHLLLFNTTTANHFSIVLWCVMKSGFYTTGDEQLSCWAEKKLQSTSQSQTCTRKRSWSLYDGLLLVWSITALWILVKPLHLRSMLSKAMRCIETCNTYGQDWSTEGAWLSCMTTPNHTLHNQCFKIWTNWASKFCLIFHIHLTFCCQPITTSSIILTTSAGKMLPQPAGVKKYFPRVHQIPKQGFLCYKNKQTYYSLAKMCWI